MRLILTGSRDFRRPDMVHHELDILLDQHGTLVVADGACPTGSDHATKVWCDAHPGRVRHELYPADWDTCVHDRDHYSCPDDGGTHRKTRKPGDIHHPGTLPTYCPPAGPRRNWRDLAPAGGDLALAFLQPGTYNGGTRNAIRACEHYHIPVERIVADETEPAAVERRNRRLLRQMTQDSIDLGLYGSTAGGLDTSPQPLQFEEERRG